jgi:hypothetical protein
VNKLQEPGVLKWERVIHKSADTADGSTVGYIAADDDESIIVLASGFREYNIPKSRVRSFDGSKVTLDFPWKELEQDRIA